MAYSTPWDRLREASQRVWNTDTGEDKDDEYKRNLDNFRKAAIHYGTHVALGKDPTYVVIIRRKHHPERPPCQLCLWPVRVIGIQRVSMARLASTG